MHRLFAALYDAAMAFWNAIAADTADAIQEKDLLRVLKNAVRLVSALLSFAAGSATVLGLLYLGRKIFVPLIGIPVVAAVLVKSYLVNQEGQAVLKANQEEQALLEDRAEALYGYVRDGIFLVLRAVSDYTPIIRPASPSAIETGARIYYHDGVAIFQFNALTSGNIESLNNLRKLLDRALAQMLRNGELPGLPSRLVSVNGKSYLPLQILRLTDLGSSVNIDVVFADEKSVIMLERQRLLNRKEPPEASSVPYDAEF